MKGQYVVTLPFLGVPTGTHGSARLKLGDRIEVFNRNNAVVWFRFEGKEYTIDPRTFDNSVRKALGLAMNAQK